NPGCKKRRNVTVWPNPLQQIPVPQKGDSDRISSAVTFGCCLQESRSLQSVKGSYFGTVTLTERGKTSCRSYGHCPSNRPRGRYGHCPPQSGMALVAFLGSLAGLVASAGFGVSLVADLSADFSFGGSPSLL